MGAEQPKNRPPVLDSFKFQNICQKVYYHVELQRDRRINQLQGREKNIKELMSKGQHRNIHDEMAAATSAITDLNYVKACNIVMRYCELLKDRSILVAGCRGDWTKIHDLMPFIESIVWASGHLNISTIKEFSDMVSLYFGTEFQRSIAARQRVDQDLVKMFQNILPNADEVQAYFIEFIKRQSLDPTLLHELGMGEAPAPSPPYYPPPAPAAPGYGAPPQNYPQAGPSGGSGAPGFPANNLYPQMGPTNPQGPGAPAYGYPQQPGKIPAVFCF